MKTGKKHKVIGVGFQKTGTTSLMQALQILGYRVSNNNTNLLFSIRRKNFKKVLRELKQYDAAEDFPWPMIYQEVDRLLPACKFILTIRDPKDWLKSVSHHISQPKIMHDWVYGKGKSVPRDHEYHFLKVYNRHIQDVKEYFKNRPEDLLVIDLTQSGQWKKLCTFLDEPIPDIPFPHANKTKTPTQGLFRKAKLLKKRIKYFFLDKYFYVIDYLYQNK